MGGVSLLLGLLGCGEPAVATDPPGRVAWEGAVPYATALGAPVDPPVWPPLADPFDEDPATVGAWSETAGRVCRGDPVTRDAWLAAVVDELGQPDRVAGTVRHAWGLTGELACDRPGFCGWIRDRYAAPGATPALRAALLTASARCDGPEDRALRIARLDAHLAAGDADGTVELLAFLTDEGMTPWLSTALEARYAASDEALRDALALGAAGSAWGPDDARAERVCAAQPERPTCQRRRILSQSGGLVPDPAVDPDGWVTRWGADPVGLVAARPDLRDGVVTATATCAADTTSWQAPPCLRALHALDPARAREVALLARFGGAAGDLVPVVDEILDHAGAGAWLGLPGTGLLAIEAARAGRRLEDDGRCERLWRDALALDPALDTAPKRVTYADTEDSAVLEVWVDGWWWRAEIGDVDAGPCPIAEAVGVANTRLRAGGSPWRWGLVDRVFAVSASDVAWRAATDAGVIPSTPP